MISAILCGDTMRDDKRYLKWCLRQERGIRWPCLLTISRRRIWRNHAMSLRSMEVNAQAGIEEWTVSASYYAKYFAVYALLSKIGVKSEIHGCTIALFGYLFSTVEYHHLVRELRQSKDDRGDGRHYTRELEVNLTDLMQQTKQFVLQIEELIDGLNSEEVAALQKKLKELAHERKS